MTALPNRRPTANLDRTSASEDAQLVTRVCAGDTSLAAWLEARLLDVPKFLGAINRRYGKAIEPHDLDDLAQETMLKVWGKLSEFSGAAPFAAWLYRFCMLEYLNSMRKHANQRPMLRLEATTDVAIEPAAFPAEDLLALLDSLPRAQAVILELRHLEGLSFPEIGARLGLTLEATRTRYYRSLRELRVRLSESPKERER